MSYLSESVGDVGTSDRDRLSHLVAAVFVVQLADDGTKNKKRVTRRMTTRSGQPYKKKSMAAEQFEKIFQFLLEDRKLRDQEFAAERDRLENERRTSSLTVLGKLASSARLTLPEGTRRFR